MKLGDLFKKTETGNISPEPAGIRSTAAIRAELCMAQDAVESVAARLSTAEAELCAAEKIYDDGIREYALGERHSEPKRSEVQELMAKLNALRQGALVVSATVTRIAAELAGAEHAEAVAAGRKQIPLLIAAADAKLAELVQVISTARRLEDELYSLLFDSTIGLCQNFASAELQRVADRARHLLRRRAMDEAVKLGFPLNPNFETDGYCNLGADQYDSNSDCLVKARALRFLHFSR